MKEKLCTRCLYLIQTWEDLFECIHPENDNKETPSELNKSKDCSWFEKSPSSMI